MLGIVKTTTSQDPVDLVWIIYEKDYYLLIDIKYKIQQKIGGKRLQLLFYLLVPSADTLCKQFGHRSGMTKCRA